MKPEVCYREGCDSTEIRDGKVINGHVVSFFCSNGHELAHLAGKRRQSMYSPNEDGSWLDGPGNV